MPVAVGAEEFLHQQQELGVLEVVVMEVLPLLPLNLVQPTLVAAVAGVDLVAHQLMAQAAQAALALSSSAT